MIDGRKRGKTSGSRFVIAGLVPAISIRRAQCPNYRDGRDKPGHDQIGTATSFATLTDGQPTHKFQVGEIGPSWMRLDNQRYRSTKAFTQCRVELSAAIISAVV